MARVCAWCARPLDAALERRPELGPGPSHGICSDCARALRDGSAPLPVLPGAGLGGDPSASVAAALDEEEEEE